MPRKAEQNEHLVSMSLGDHLEELRSRLILIIIGLVVGLIICLFFGKYLIAILTTPFNKAIGATADVIGLQTIRPAEGFLMYMKICFFFGLLVTSPWVFWQIWAFISSGLYRREKKFVSKAAPASAVLFVAGAIFFLTSIAPLAMKFFIKFNKHLSLASNWTFQYYINMVLILTLVFGLAFQMPIAIIFAERMGLVTIQMLTRGRKYIILGLVFIAAVATPPDFISQIGLAIPLYVLFEGSIILCRIMRKRKEQADK